MHSHGIPRDRIFDSRTSSFHNQIMKMTKGRGVDLVLNILSGGLLHTSWKCVTEFGRMVEIGKRDVTGQTRLDLAAFGIIGHSLGSILPYFPFPIYEGTQPPPDLQDSTLTICSLADHLLGFLGQGLIRQIDPIIPSRCSRQKGRGSFRYMQSGYRMGRLIVFMPESRSELSATRVAPKPYLDPEATYILVGGLEALGRAT